MMCSKVSVFLLAVASIILASTGSASAQIVALGHSAVRGHVAENEMWPAVLESMLSARGSQVHVINAGINGETTGEELARVDSAIPDGTGSSSWPSMEPMTRAETSPAPPRPLRTLRRSSAK